jgi:hypothetical protein
LSQYEERMTNPVETKGLSFLSSSIDKRISVSSKIPLSLKQRFSIKIPNLETDEMQHTSL